jgi:very-short-patch-repair endonuclease
MVSHVSAGMLYRLDGIVPDDDVHVTVSYERSLCTQPGFRLHRSQLIDDDDRRTVDGIVVTAPARTVLDLAGVLRPERLESAFEAFRRRGLLTTGELAARFETLGGRGRPGTRAVRTLIHAHLGEPALESRLEVRAARLFRSSALPRPVRQHRLVGSDGNRYRLDFAWPDRRVAVECQGFRWHGSRLTWKQDSARTTAIESLGWRVLTVTWDDVVERPSATLDRVAGALRRAAA